MTTELLQQVRVLDPVTQMDQVADVLIEAGVVTAIGVSLTDYPSDAIVHNCQGLILGPGLVDLYSHSGEPGFEERETLQSLMYAAAAGGFTRLAVLPNTVPPMDTVANIAWFNEKKRAKLQSPPHTLMPPPPTPHLHAWAALTADVKGQQMTELAELATAEMVGFADGRPIQNLLLVRRILEYSRPFGKPVALWACDLNLANNGVMREGQESLLLGLPGVPAIAETSALVALLECVEEVGTPVHFMRISTARSVELIRLAKSRGLPVTASTPWMHLLLNTENLGSYDPNLRFDPPLGTPADQMALVKAVQAGIVDAIAIDHIPYTYEEKTVAFSEAPPGAIGLELAMPLLWQSLVTPGYWSALDLWNALSRRPAHCLHQPPPRLVPGQPAEMILFNPRYSWKVESGMLKSLAMNTPWLGREITGRVMRNWC
jgi:dihydroorotase